MNDQKNRFERKWAFRNFSLHELELALRRSNFNFTKHFPERTINSIYFDDLKNSLANENLDGIYRKNKIRLRWYGNTNIIKNSSLEIKEKHGYVVNKKKNRFKDFNDLQIFDEGVLAKITEKINGKFKFTKEVFPIYLVSYSRKYFISQLNSVRATLDNNMNNYKIINMNIINIKNNYNDVILEMKYHVNLDEYVRNNLKTSNRFVKYSKYVNSFFKHTDRLE